MFEIRELTVPFIIAGAIDFLGSIIIIGFAIKYRKLRVHEFYHYFILGFLLIAYYTRIVELIYLMSTKSCEKFNREFGRSHRIELLLVNIPFLFHGLTGFAYLFRWASYIAFTTANRNVTELKVVRRVNFIKITFLTVGTLLILTLVVLAILKLPYIIFKVIMISFHFLTSISLIIVVQIFLSRMKRNNFYYFKTKKGMIRGLTTTIAIGLLLRILSEVINLAFSSELSKKSDSLQDFVDIVVISTYFIEIIPSLLITYVLWRSYQEIKSKRKDINASGVSGDSPGKHSDLIRTDSSNSRPSHPQNLEISYKEYSKELIESISNSGLEDSTVIKETNSPKKEQLTYF